MEWWKGWPRWGDAFPLLERQGGRAGGWLGGRRGRVRGIVRGAFGSKGDVTSPELVGLASLLFL